jgi:outer membrane protein OmpA-like peptidoglycan-associated protein
MKTMSMPQRGALAAFLLAALLAGCASTLSASKALVTLTGNKEVPSVNTQAAGEAWFTVDRDWTINGKVTTSGIAATAAHVHEGRQEENGPVVVPLVRSGDNEWTVAPNTRLTEGQFKSYRAGRLYVNVHSAAYPARPRAGALFLFSRGADSMKTTWHCAGLLALWVLGGCSSIGGRTPAAADVHGAETPAGKGFFWSRTLEAKQMALEKVTANTGIEVMRTKDNQLQVNVPSDFSFDTDKAEIKPDMRQVLDQFAHGLEAKALSHMLIRIVGHADSRGPDAVNDPLSRARAQSVRDHLIALGIAPARIQIDGAGEHQPQVDNRTTYGRALNRRVEIFLRDPDGRS